MPVSWRPVTFGRLSAEGGDRFGWEARPLCASGRRVLEYPLAYNPTLNPLKQADERTDGDAPRSLEHRVSPYISDSGFTIPYSTHIATGPEVAASA